MTPLRASLFNPPNAVPDSGIDLRRPKLNVAAVALRPSAIEMPLIQPRPAATPSSRKGTVYSIIVEVSAGFDMTRMQLLSPGRRRPLVQYRQAAMAIARRFTPFSLPHLGRAFGGYDHTTILYAIRKMQPHIDAVAAELPADATPIE